MKLIKGVALGIVFSLACATGFAAEKTEKNKDLVKPPRYHSIAPINIKNMPNDNLTGRINAAKMKEALKADEANSLLYIKYSENKVLSFKDLAKDRGACRQIIYASPNNQILELYTNDKKVFHQMYKNLKAYTGEFNLVDGYKVVCDKSPAIKLDNGKTMYKFWFKKVKPDNRVVRVIGSPYPYDYPVHMGVYWGPRYYRHHHHHIVRPVPRPAPRR